MKRFIALVISFGTITTGAFGWGKLGHSTVAYIAEQHLTPKAKKALNEYLHGYSLVSVASLNDDCKSIMKVDMGYDFKDAKRIAGLPHTFEVASETFDVNRNICDNGRYVKNCIWFIDHYADNLKKNACNMDDSTRFAQIASIVHFLGDMHCPEHIRYYPEDMTIGYYDVIWNGKPIRFHTLWDIEILTDKRDWSFSDLAYLIDRPTKKKVKEITAGNVWDWAKDSAECSYPVHKTQPGDTLGEYYTLENQVLAESQLLKAGHRLAAILNEIFK